VGCADELGGELIVAVATEPARDVLIFGGIQFAYKCMTFCRVAGIDGSSVEVRNGP
jgi:hypothetical protein